MIDKEAFKASARDFEWFQSQAALIRSPELRAVATDCRPKCVMYVPDSSRFGQWYRRRQDPRSIAVWSLDILL